MEKNNYEKIILSVAAAAMICLSFSSCGFLLLNKAAKEIGKEINDAVDKAKNLAVSIEYTDENEGASWEGTFDYGTNITLKVTASAAEGSIAYQWYKAKDYYSDGTAISGATGDSFTVPSNEESDAYYYCKATNTEDKDYYSRTNRIHVKFTMIKVISDSITQNQKWYSKYTYLIDSDIYLYATLEIEPNTVIKFNEGAWLSSSTNGTIVAKGEENAPIIFTSYRDNSKGLKVLNSTGNPEPGDWEGVRTQETNGSQFIYCKFYYAGSERQGALRLEAKTTVDHCTFAYNTCDYNSSLVGALDVYANAKGSTVTNNIFYSNDVPLGVPAFFTVDKSNVFHSESSTNKKPYIIVWGDDSITDGNTIWAITEIPYLARENITVEQTGVLTVEDGVIVKFRQGDELDVYSGATLTAKDCIFTSIKDDANGGDTNGDGDATTPENGNWKGVWIEDEDGWNNSIQNNSAKVKFISIS